jgi:undecaprenyl-diphosphatase
MWFAERAYSKRAVHKDLTITSGVGIGFFQTLALLPGVSRSGSTISGGFLLGLNREEATKFSFLLALPILAGSGLKKLLELDFGASGALSGHLFIASLAALGAAIISIHFLINFLKTNSLKPFIWYRIVLACVLLLFL